MKRQRINLGDEVEVIVRPLRESHARGDDQHVFAAAKKIMADHRQDFKNLAARSRPE